MGSTPPVRGGAKPAATRLGPIGRAATFAALALAVALALVSVAASTSAPRFSDDIAAVYDFAVVDRADRLDHVVAFVAFSTPAGTGGIALADVLVQTAERVPGIDPGTARATAQPPALSFSYDARNTNVDEVLQRLAAAAPVPVQFAVIRSIRPAYPSSAEPPVLDFR